jgi:hypothetical protein
MLSLFQSNQYGFDNSFNFNGVYAFANNLIGNKNTINTSFILKSNNFVGNYNKANGYNKTLGSYQVNTNVFGNNINVGNNFNAIGNQLNSNIFSQNPPTNYCGDYNIMITTDSNILQSISESKQSIVIGNRNRVYGSYMVAIGTDVIRENIGVTNPTYTVIGREIIPSYNEVIIGNTINTFNGTYNFDISSNNSSSNVKIGYQIWNTLVTNFDNKNNTIAIGYKAQNNVNVTIIIIL